MPANECVPDVASISAAAGVPLVPDVLTVPGSAIAFISALAGVSAAASFLRLMALCCCWFGPPLPILASLCYCSW